MYIDVHIWFRTADLTFDHRKSCRIWNISSLCTFTHILISETYISTYTWYIDTCIYTNALAAVESDNRHCHIRIFLVMWYNSRRRWPQLRVTIVIWYITAANVSYMFLVMWHNSRARRPQSGATIAVIITLQVLCDVFIGLFWCLYRSFLMSL